MANKRQEQLMREYHERQTAKPTDITLPVPEKKSRPAVQKEPLIWRITRGDIILHIRRWQWVPFIWNMPEYDIVRVHGKIRKLKGKVNSVFFYWLKAMKDSNNFK